MSIKLNYRINVHIINEKIEKGNNNSNLDLPFPYWL